MLVILASLVVVGLFALYKLLSPKYIPGKSLKVILPAPAKSKKYINSIHGKDKIICYDPSTGEFLAERVPSTPDQVKAIVQAAREAQQEYQSTTFAQRRAILSTLLDYIVENQTVICELVARDSGKTLIDANFGEILTTCEKLKWTIRHGEQALASEYRSPGMIMAHKTPRVDYVPVGVMGAIVSWNYPVHNALGPVISALMAGNACVVKCSEYVAYTTPFLQSLMNSVLEAYGINPSLVTFVNGYGDAGEALVECADKITFIGSPGVGKMVMKHASETLTPVILELGGKDCALVFEDCDYDQFYKNSQRYCFQNSGQNCAGLERVIIHESLYERYLEDMTALIANIRLGPPLLEDVDCGAITMAKQINIIQSLIDDAVEKGATVLVGGEAMKHPNYPYGQYFSPTLITNIKPNMRIAKEEVFGPVLLVFKFTEEEEAIEIANSCSFGLGSGVFSLNFTRAERVGRKLQAGFTNINDFGVNYLCQGLPFGGVKVSGVDCFAGVEGLRGNCYPKAVTVDKYWGIRTRLPALLQYPITKNGFLFQESTVKLLYSFSWRERLNNLWNIIKVSLTHKNKMD